MVPSVSVRSHVSPQSAPLPVIEATIVPLARKGFAHISGEARGSRLTYEDLNAFAWWYGGGWLTLNRGKKGLRRVHRGAEDVSRVRR